MSQPYRIPDRGRIDRTAPLSFTFNGRPYGGYRGDTLASALLANGVRLVARSFKYHRPRGIVTAGSEEPSALVQLEAAGHTQPNTRATMIELYQDLSARSQNCWPSVERDLWALNGLLSPIIVAGFYYKTFMWPQTWWKGVYERLIRGAAGMGSSPLAPDPDRYVQRLAHCDVLVVGGGPSGLAAALAASRTGARVILADEHAELGGRLLSDREEIDGRPAMDWVAASLTQLAASPEVTVLPRTTVAGYYDHNYLIALERVTDHLGPGLDDPRPRERLWKIRADQVVIAAGAIERPAVFAHNDRPGIMLAGAARTYLNRFGVLLGRDVVVLTNNDDAYRTAFDTRTAGAAVRIVDVRANGSSLLLEAARDAGIDVYTGQAIVGTAGSKTLRGCTIARLDAAGTSFTGASRRLSCDTILTSAGWNPSVHLWSQARGTLGWDEAKACFLPDSCPQKTHAAGACNGAFGLADCLAEGTRAGAQAAVRRRLRKRTRHCHPRPQRGKRRPASSASLAVPSRGALDRSRWHFPRPPERRHRRGHSSRRPRRLHLRRAPQALHHNRHGHRPGQDLQRQRTCGHGRHPRSSHSRAGHHHLPPPLHAGNLRRRRRPGTRHAVRATPQDPHAHMARAPRRDLRAGRKLAQALGLSDVRRSARRRRAAGMQDRAPRRRTLRRLNPRQDRHPGSRCSRSSRPGLHQPLVQSAHRALPLRNHAERPGHGDGRRRHHPHCGKPFPHDHHHRRRRDRPRLARAMVADRMARSRGLSCRRDRAVGGRGALRPPLARGPPGADRTRPRSRTVSLHVLSRDRRRRRARPHLPHQLHGRALLRNQCAVALRQLTCGSSSPTAEANTVSAPTARKPCTC